MAGDARLEGDLGLKAMKMLKDVAGVLKKNKVRFILDCGTLLGFVRENRILPWDNDMDISVASTELPKLRKCAFLLWLKGYRVRFARAGYSYGPIKKGAPRILKVRNRKGFLHRGDILLDIFIKYPDIDGDYVLMVGRDDESIIQKFPAAHLMKLTEYCVDGNVFPIPEDYDGYLTGRYGDWRTPVKDWDFYKDDCSKIR